MRTRIHVAVGLCLVALVVLYTWPLARDLSGLPDGDTDSRMFTWVMVSIFRNLLAQPALLLHGNAFYPAGNSLTFAEPLLTPALVAGPLYFVSGNPVLSYKVTLLLFWALSGWAMYAVTLGLTRSHPAALVAAVIFTVSPPRLEYYGEFQMEMAFGVPLAVYALVRFLEEQRTRHLIALLAVFWVQAVAVWYYAVILGFGLAVIALQYVALRWSGWRLRTLVAAGLGTAALLLALAPVAWPFFVTRRELGFERHLEDIDASRFADLLTYLTTRGSWLARLVRIDTAAETSLFVGAVALGLAVVSALWLRRGGQPRGGAERVLAAAVWACLGGALLAAAAGRPIRIGPVRSPFAFAGTALLGLALGRHAVEGWRRHRDGLRDRGLSDRDWVALLLVLVAFAALISLGPVVHVAGRSLGGGLYAWLYPSVLPLHVIRGATRFGLLAAFALALLAGFGTKWLLGRLPPRSRAPAAAAAVLLLLVEYAHVPLPYQAVPVLPRPVDAVLRRDPDDVAVLEWPPNVPDVDADAMFRSLAHGKRVVNGFGGFVPDFLAELSGLLTTAGPPFPVPEALAALRQVYPLRYLVVRLAAPGTEEWRAAWRALRDHAPPDLRFRGTFGTEDLYEIVPQPEQGPSLERRVSYEFIRRHPVLTLSLRPLVSDPQRRQWVEVTLNDRTLTRAPVDRDSRVTVALSPPFTVAAPNVIRLRYRYELATPGRDARYRIGTTGVLSPGDLRVRSVGQPHGSASSIELDGAELSPDRRGYNLVALAPDGTVRAGASFDTFLDSGAAPRLAAWVSALPAGTIVAGAVRDEGSGLLTGAAVQALRTLGVAGDLRGHFREAHAFVGVKGAAPGTALEALGPRPIELRVGRPEPRPGFELTGFAMAA